MKRRSSVGLVAVGIAFAALSAATRADTIVLKDGRRVDGELVAVRAGQTVYFTAAGRVRWGPNRQDGPDGEHGSPHNPTRPIPNRPAAGLIGRVGESNDYFFIGDEKGPIRVRSSGRLYLGIND